MGRRRRECRRCPGLSVGVNGQPAPSQRATARRAGFDAAYDRGPIRLVVEAVTQSYDCETRREASGYYVLGVWRRPATKPTSLYAGYELAARFVDVEDNARVAMSKTLQLVGTTT